MSVAVQTSANIHSQNGTALTADLCQELWIADYVRICRTDCGTVFLDLRKGKYFALSEQDSSALGSAIRNWPREDSSGKVCSRSDDAQLRKLVANLSSAGLLVATPVKTAVITTGSANIGTLVAVGEDLSASVRVRAGHLLAFTSACLWALTVLKTKSFEELVLDLCDRRNMSSGTMNEERLVDLVSTFRLLRPFAFTAHDRCLFHALALTRFLSYYKLFPTWMIGVRMNPWGAHSWVQHEHLVLDATPEKVIEFTPILAV